MLVQTDGKILVSGFFTSIGGQPRNHMARLDPMTGLADSFNPNADGSVVAIGVQADGKVLAGGNFTNIGGQIRNNLARLDAATGLADTFNPNVTGSQTYVWSLAIQTDGKILVGGEFSGIGGQVRRRLARLEPSTGLADSFDPNANGVVYSVAAQADGKILAGGVFSNIGGQARTDFARLTNDSAALEDLIVTQTAVTWTRTGASAQFTRTTFEYSADNLNYVILGSGTASGSSWTLGGLSLPTGINFYVRARGYYRGGWHNGSESIIQSVRNGFLDGPPPSPTPTPTAAPSATPTPAATPLPTASPTATPTATATPGSLGNISTRLRVLSGDNALIGGMIATGTATKKVIIRAIGPTLTDFGVPGALQDPTLELYQGSTLITSNDNWRMSPQEVEIQNSGLAPNKDAESAIIATLTPNQNYTAIVRGKNGETGVGVVEAFDLEQGSASKLGNISTRGFVDVDDNVMIAGLIVSPSSGTGTKILVRALGPTLGDFGVPNALADPTLELVNSSGTVIRSNDNWRTDQQSEIDAANLAPAHNEEAALVQTVAPGAYTAVVRGAGRTIGVGLVEAYNIQ
jgi:hypothetical protein